VRRLATASLSKSKIGQSGAKAPHSKETPVVTVSSFEVSIQSGHSPGINKEDLGVRTSKNEQLGRFKTLAIATLSAIALAGSIALAQSVNTGQGNTTWRNAQTR